MISKCTIGFIILYIILSIGILYLTGVFNLNKTQPEQPLTQFQIINKSSKPYVAPGLPGFKQVGYPPFGNFQHNGVQIDDNEMIISDKLGSTLNKCKNECVNNSMCGAFNFNMDKKECVLFGNKTTKSSDENIISYIKNN